MNIKWTAFKDKMPKKSHIYVHDTAKNTIEIYHILEFINKKDEQTQNEWREYIGEYKEMMDFLWAHIPIPKVKKIRENI